MEKKRGYQRYPRFTKRLEAAFSSGGLSFRGILSNISSNGLFIRTNRGFTPGTAIDIEIMMPDNKVSLLKGIVKRTTKTPLSLMKNGMGVELTEKDSVFTDYMKLFMKETGKDPGVNGKENAAIPEFKIIACPHCGTKNKVRSEKLDHGPKCGRCGTSLAVDKT
jgi:hypothetical protein